MAQNQWSRIFGQEFVTQTNGASSWCRLLCLCWNPETLPFWRGNRKWKWCTWKYISKWIMFQSLAQKLFTRLNSFNLKNWRGKNESFIQSIQLSPCEQFQGHFWAILFWCRKKIKKQIKSLGLIRTYLKAFFSSATDLKVSISVSSKTQRELSQVLAQRTKQNNLFN